MRLLPPSSACRTCFGGLVFAMLATLFSSGADGQTLAKRGWAGSGITVAPWWQGVVIYQIDPVSFQDSDGDGFGDLRGIVQRLDYLQSLGVDVLLLSPMELETTSGRGPARPFDPALGTEEDFDELLRQASLKKMHVFVDLPVSATRTGEEVSNVARFWLSRGVAGLRIVPAGADHSAANAVAEPAINAVQLQERLVQVRKLAATYPGQRVLMIDAGGLVVTGPSLAHASSRRRRSRAAGVPPVAPQIDAQMVVDRGLLAMSEMTSWRLRAALTSAGSSAAMPVLLSDSINHARSWDRIGFGADDLAIAKLLAAALLTGPGAPMLYFGQELGMATTPEPGSGSTAGGDPTPMQWGQLAKDDPGFTRGVPWLEMGRNDATANVALEDADTESLLSWYRRLSALHHARDALRGGGLEMLLEQNPDVVAWVRRAPGLGNSAAVLVVCNVSARAVMVSPAADLRRLGLASTGMARTLLSSDTVGGKQPDAPVSVTGIALPAFGVWIGELGRQAGLESAPAPVRRYGRRASRPSASSVR